MPTEAMTTNRVVGAIGAGSDRFGVVSSFGDAFVPRRAR
jgi:hypothetical protein